MSRSYTKNTYSRNAQSHSRASEKKDKQIWHQRYRSITKQICRSEKDNDELSATNFPVENEVSQVYDFAKDGKHYIKATIMKELYDNNYHQVTKQLTFRK